MSDEQVHAQHQFIPKLLRRKVAAAVENYEALKEHTRKQLVVLLLANRNASIAKRGRKWFSKSTADIPSIAETIALAHDLKRITRLTSFWSRHYDDSHPEDAVIFGPHSRARLDLMHELDRGSKWVKLFYELQDNLKRSPTRRVIISGELLSSINYWAGKTFNDT